MMFYHGRLQIVLIVSLKIACISGCLSDMTHSNWDGCQLVLSTIHYALIGMVAASKLVWVISIELKFTRLEYCTSYVL